jgi:release factor glutamine methyltransferase
MLIADVLAKAQKLSLRTEMEVYLAHLMGVRRLDLIARSDEEVPVENLADLQVGWTKIQDGVPVAYLINEKEFYGINLYVDERVLVPRGETELLVDLVLEREPKSVLEIGTGSGAVAVALAKNLDARIMAVEVSEEALEVANKNVVQCEVDVELIQSDLLEKVGDEEFDILVANLPYIGEEEHNLIDENVQKHEPHVALFGGEDGLRLYAKMFEQIREQGREFKWIVGEIGFSQGAALKGLAAELLPEYDCEIRKDLQDLDRHFVLTGR